MKPVEEQSYFEILDVSPEATQADLDAAYLRAKKYLGPGSTALYTLTPPEEAEAFIARVEAAYQVLSDPDLRQKYRAGLGDASGVPLAAVGRSRPQQEALGGILADVDSSPWRRPARADKVEDLPSATASSTESEPAPPVKASAPEEGEAKATPVEAPTTESRKEVSEPAPRPAAAPVAAEAPAMASEMALEEAPPRKPVVAPRPEAPRAFEAAPDARFSGELLRRVRESKGLTLKDLADRTRITSSHLESVEADHYEVLPARVYLRGMLMSIARELRLDPVRVSKSYLELVDQAARTAEDKVDAPKRRP